MENNTFIDSNRKHIEHLMLETMTVGLRSSNSQTQTLKQG